MLIECGERRCAAGAELVPQLLSSGKGVTQPAQRNLLRLRRFMCRGRNRYQRLQPERRLDFGNSRIRLGRRQRHRIENVPHQTFGNAS